MTAVRRLSLVDTEAADAAPPPGAVRVAIASTDLKGLNAHFGSAPKFAVYDVTPAGWSFVEAVEFEGNTEGDGTHRGDGDDVPLPFRGVAIALVTAGLMSLAFMGFAGLDKYQ